MRGVATKESKCDLKLKNQYTNCKISCCSLHSTTCKKKIPSQLTFSFPSVETSGKVHSVPPFFEF